MTLLIYLVIIGLPLSKSTFYNAYSLKLKAKPMDK